MNPYQPIPFHILSFAVFQSRILIYAGSNIYDGIAEEEKYLRGRIDLDEEKYLRGRIDLEEEKYLRGRIDLV